MAIDQYQKIVPFIIFVLALIFLFFLVKPMIVIVLSSIILAYIAFPISKRIDKKIPKHKSLSIVLSLFVIFLIVLIPFSFLAFEIIQEGSHFYNSLSTTIVKGELFGFGCTSADSKICLLINQAEKFSLERLSEFGFDKQLQGLIPVFEEKITKFILTMPLIIAQIFLTFIISFFVMKDWKNILRRTVDLLPMRKKSVNQLIREFGTITHTVIYTQLLIALAQGLVGTIGYFIFGVPLPILLGFATAFFSLIPTVGTAIIWLPASLYLILNGHISNDSIILFKGIGLFLYGFFIISMIDNIILAKVVNKKANVNQILVIVGVIGGGALFGVPGIFIGPILLPLLITYFRTFKERHDA